MCCRLTSLVRDGLPISDGYFYQSRDNDSSSKSRVGENGGEGKGRWLLCDEESMSPEKRDDVHVKVLPYHERSEQVQANPGVG